MAMAQLAGEQLDQTKTSRRPIFQALVMWDAFRNLFDPIHPPAFTTFFTNHVASAMHRYWNSLFPEDFADNDCDRHLAYLATMRFAMRVVDRILAEAMDFCSVNPDLIVVFATSMGQAAIRRDHHEGVQALLSDVSKFATRAGPGAGRLSPLVGDGTAGRSRGAVGIGASGLHDVISMPAARFPARACFAWTRPATP